MMPLSLQNLSRDVWGRYGCASTWRGQGVVSACVWEARRGGARWTHLVNGGNNRRLVEQDLQVLDAKIRDPTPRASASRPRTSRYREAYPMDRTFPVPSQRLHSAPCLHECRGLAVRDEFARRGVVCLGPVHELRRVSTGWSCRRGGTYVEINVFDPESLQGFLEPLGDRAVVRSATPSDGPSVQHRRDRE